MGQAPPGVRRRKDRRLSEELTLGFVDRRAAARQSRLRRFCDPYATCPVRSFRPKVEEARDTIQAMTAKEKLLEQAPRWNDAQATAALRVVEAHDELAAYLDEQGQSADEREDRWATENAREAIREERW